MEKENIYSLTEIILGKGNRYIEHRILLTDETIERCFDVAFDFEEIFEDDIAGEEYDRNARTLIHIFSKKCLEDGAIENTLEMKITRNQKGTTTDKTIYIDRENYDLLPEHLKTKSNS